MIAIISDIHGNFPALKAVIKDIHKQNCTEIISLGDVAGYYCMINECIELCKQEHIVNIMGNHDYYLVSGNNCPRSNSVNITIEYQRKIITKSNYLWLTESAPFIDTVYVSLRHGGWNDPLDEYIVEFNWNSVKSFPQLVFISGHTHKQSYQVYNNRVYANPGSVGQPRDYDNRAGYLTLSDTGKIELHRVEYPIEDIIRKSEIAGFESRISSCLRTGTRIGELD